ncbi:Hypothetical predicted protein [Xyrichtys novacula]|uniref:Uncharacterized protein n=1 Tax=Xyrichtys novacula TaxID=13765 RepID=A0AAV1FCE7_XYRNO|nr:Hypothetical predicted protein [Xyrichtys novacula]
MLSRLTRATWDTISMTMQAVGRVSSVFSREEQKALLHQNEELRTHLQLAQQRISSQEQTTNQLAGHLETERADNCKLRDQVEYLTAELKNFKSIATYHRDSFKRERAKYLQEEEHVTELKNEVEYLKNLLAKSENSLTATEGELVNLSQSYQELYQRYAFLRNEKKRADLLQQQFDDERWSHDELRIKLEEIIENQETERKAHEHKNDVLQQQPENAKSCAKQVLEHQEEIQRLRAERDALQQKIDHDEERKHLAKKTSAKKILKLKAERKAREHKNDVLQQQLEQERSCAKQVLEHQEEIQRLRAEKDALQQKIDHDQERKRLAKKTSAKKILNLKAERKACEHKIDVLQQQILKLKAEQSLQKGGKEHQLETQLQKAL